MNTARALLLLLPLCALQGCETVALTSHGVAKHAGIEQSLTGRSFKTFSTTLPTLRLATLKAFQRMGIRVNADAQAQEGWTIKGVTHGREIEVNFERISRRTTRMKVLVERNIPLLGDGATGTEIILQTTEMVDRMAVRG